MKKVLFNWSGGKDSSLCLYNMLATGDYEVAHLITTINQEKRRISMHGVREKLLDIQADCLGLPLYKVLLPDHIAMYEYDQLMKDALTRLQGEADYAVFGDIFLEDLRSYREQRLAESGMKALFPLWKKSTDQLSREFVELGFKAVVVCVNGSKLSKSFVGREYNSEFLKDLPAGIDPCGEYGEFHTFVYDGPIFKRSVPFDIGDIVCREYSGADHNRDREKDHQTNKSSRETIKYWFCDLSVCR